MYYRTLTRVMRAYKWPLSSIEELFDDLSGGQLFKTLDLFYGVWKVRMVVDFKGMTELICQFGTYHLEVMPFGLMTVPWTF